MYVSVHELCMLTCTLAGVSLLLSGDVCGCIIRTQHASTNAHCTNAHRYMSLGALLDSKSVGAECGCG
eukprot:6186738-Pleurochrysis_carterae.AAC.1